jgi:hypothetical protein
VVALNVLTFVGELVSEAGRPARPRVVRVGDFSVVEASRRASLMRVGTWSRCSVHGLARSAFVGGAFGVVFLGVCLSLSFECGYLWFRYPTVLLLVVGIKN